MSSKYCRKPTTALKICTDCTTVHSLLYELNHLTLQMAQYTSRLIQTCLLLQSFMTAGLMSPTNHHCWRSLLPWTGTKVEGHSNRCRRYQRLMMSVAGFFHMTIRVINVYIWYHQSHGLNATLGIAKRHLIKLSSYCFPAGQATHEMFSSSMQRSIFLDKCIFAIMCRSIGLRAVELPPCAGAGKEAHQLSNPYER